MGTHRKIDELRRRIRQTQLEIIMDDERNPRFTSDDRCRLTFALIRLTYAEDMLAQNCANLAARQYKEATNLAAGIIGQADVIRLPREAQRPRDVITFRPKLAKAS